MAIQPVRVVLVSPYELPRLAMVRLLESLEDVVVVAHASDADAGRHLAEKYGPDVLVVDGEIASLDAMRTIAELKAQLNGVRVLLLADRATQVHVETALEAGIDGYTLKNITLNELHNTIGRLAGGDTVLHPDVASVIARRLAANGKEKANSLTPRQREILRLLAAGLENKQIARQLGIGVHTVKTHVSRVLAKLGAASRTEAVVLAMRDHLIT